MAKLSRRKIASFVADELSKGGKTEQLIRQVAAYLIETRRTKEASLLARDIEYELKQRGIVLADITSAFDLAEVTEKEITHFIKDQTGASKIYLRQFIDPTVIGGIKLNLADQELDSTIARRLTNLRTNYKN